MLERNTGRRGDGGEIQYLGTLVAYLKAQLKGSVLTTVTAGCHYFAHETQDYRNSNV